MYTIIKNLILSFIQRKNNAQLHTEIAWLKVQLQEAKREHIRPILSNYKKFVLAFMTHFIPNWKRSSILFTPETILRWRKKQAKIFWTLLSKKKKAGRPTISRKVINLIKRVSKDNPDSGDGKIVGQLLELGFRVCERTVAKYKVRHTDPDKSQSWFAFIRNSDIASIDLFTVPSNSFRQMFALVIIKNSTRELIFSNATYYPNQLWLSRQLLNAFDDPPKYLLRDNDSNYGPIYKHMVEHILDMKDLNTQYRSPW